MDLFCFKPMILVILGMEKKVMENFFSPVKFEHHIYKNESAYILLNRKAPKGSLIKIERLFMDYYDF